MMLRSLLAILCTLCIGAAAAAAESVTGHATIISVQGRVEYRADAGGDWKAASVRQRLSGGQSLRTGAGSRAALLLSDRTQIRLNERTELDVVTVEPAPRSAGQTRFRQTAGRAWVQSKTPPRELRWDTPTATAGIRGTDWEMAVEPDGRSLLSVFSGSVSLANDQGSIEVGASEQALVELGKAPVKRLVQNLRDRIQWVSAYVLDPSRQVTLDGADLPTLRQRVAQTQDPVERGRILADLGRWTEAKEAFLAAADSPAAAIGLAWVALRDGDPATASAQLERASAARDSEAWMYADAARRVQILDLDGASATLDALRGRTHLTQPAAWLLLSDIAAFNGDVERALAIVADGSQRFPDHPRLHAQKARLLLLADRAEAAAAAADAAIAADLASFDGWLARADVARREGRANDALAAYGLAIAIKPDDDRGWFGRGVVLSEREYVREARTDLARALSLNPGGPGYHGEIGTLESFADDYPAAEAAYRAALAENPADFVAQTGLGVLALKRGDPAQALETLLKAGVMEPRYARAHVYTAAAYTQLGDIRQAREELMRATELDDKDPLPYFMRAIIETDHFAPAEAVDASRQALRRLPYLKSLNQLANDQQGSANLGQAFAFMGLEEWARAYAQESYNPFWAGSHLFLADRYSGLFSKNSELFQGLISDPTVFGASTRQRSLVRSPDRNLDLSLRYTHSDSVDGFSPQVQWSGLRADPTPLAWYLGYEGVDWDLLDRPYDLDVVTAALGLRPRHDLGLFAFADASRQDSRPTGTSAGVDYDVSDRLDTRRLDLGLHYRRAPDSLWWLKAGLFDSTEKTAGLLDLSDITARTDVETPEFGFRNTRASGDHLLSWGMDYARRATDAFLDDPAFFLRNDYRIRERSLDLYLSDSFTVNPQLSLHGDLVYQDHQRSALDQPSVTLFDPPLPGFASTEAHDASQLSPRLGLVWRPDSQKRLRFAWQRWLRPAGFSSLGPVATAGIPLDDRLVMRGGELNRARLQGEWELGERSFLSGYLDYKDIDNRRFTIRPFSVSELESLNKLRPRDYGQLMRDDLYEFVDAPDYAGGVIRTAGLDFNRMVGRNWGVSGRYIYTDSRNVDDASLDVPFLPRHTLALGTTWIHPSGWYVAGRLAWRSGRFSDEANSMRLDSGLSGDLDIFWESRDKHWLFRFSANDLIDDNRDSQYTIEVNHRF